MPAIPTRLLLGFAAGAIAVLTFHQGAVWILSQLHLLQGVIYSTVPVPPFGVPRIVSLCFWGGLYGAVFALVYHRLPLPTWLSGIGLGIIAALVALLIVPRIKGTPVVAHWMTWPVGRSLIINGTWGLGVGLIMPWFMSRRSARRGRS
ncbi:MAG: hypothetical protein AB7F35_01405 [Acetobacteraceae bacterium]